MQLEGKVHAIVREIKKEAHQRLPGDDNSAEYDSADSKDEIYEGGCDDGSIEFARWMMEKFDL